MELLKTNAIPKILKTFLLIFLGTMALTVSAKIKIPFYPVPMTMQTFVVLFLGLAYGYKIGLATVSIYLLEGIIGIPVFSNSPEKGVGLIYFTGPTMGYLLGFLITAYFAGSFNYSKNTFVNFFKLTFATSFIYIIGILWLGTLIGWEKPIFKLGAQPFLLAELFKILIITLVVSKVKKIRDLI